MSAERYDGKLGGYLQSHDAEVNLMLSQVAHGRQDTEEDVTAMRQKLPGELEDFRVTMLKRSIL